MFEDNDKYWDLLWEKIDKAEKFVCITTYDMDHKMVAGITLQKLTNAAKRGVSVFLVVDDLNYYVSDEGAKTLEAAGGICIRNNPFKDWRMHYYGKGLNRFF